MSRPKTLFKGSCIGLGALEGYTVDTLPLTYEISINPKTKPAPIETLEYTAIALTNPHLRLTDSIQMLRLAIKVARAGIPNGASLLCPRKGAIEHSFLDVRLAWEVSQYVNHADNCLPAGAGSEAFKEGMIVTFKGGLHSRERVAALELILRKLTKFGLPKGLVPLGNDEKAEVLVTKFGLEAVYQGEIFDF